MISKPKKNTIQPSRIEKNAAPKRIAGLSMTCTSSEELGGAASLWQKIGEYMGKIPGQIGGTAYGLCIDTDDGSAIEYIAGTEVSGEGRLPESFVVKQLPSFTYAVFEHRGHVSSIFQTCDAIWKEWIPESGAQKPGNADFFFERYGEKFDPKKGEGDIEIWVPVEI